MERKNKLAWFLFCLVILIFIFSIFFSSHLIEEKQIPVYLEIGNSSSFDISTDLLNFGSLVVNSSESKNILLSNSYSFSVLYSFEVVGNVSEFLVYEKSIVLIPKTNSTFVLNTIVIPEKYGNYSGILNVKISRFD
jgi:hypothetical protein